MSILGTAISRTNSQETVSMEGSRPAAPAQPGTVKTSLAATLGIDKLTEKSQVSEDGTMVSVQHTPSDHSDTESNSGRDNEDVFYTEAETARRRLSSVSSVSSWTPTPEWSVYGRQKVQDGRKSCESWASSRRILWMLFEGHPVLLQGPMGGSFCGREVTAPDCPSRGWVGA
ncbi:protein HID1-like [Brienomyrus brachyistius]|uniref:protein HID1-like n=1 Tax=Brienomyrus brachyistius TaxID=42636 RepID=UPI0020B3EDBC|nr:protein HID1-like [Brienomyrus brachyistius]